MILILTTAPCRVEQQSDFYLLRQEMPENLRASYCFWQDNNFTAKCCYLS